MGKSVNGRTIIVEVFCGRFALSWPGNSSSRLPSPAERSTRSCSTQSCQFLQWAVAEAVRTMRVACLFRALDIF
jgi:hypothetical protein